MEHSTSSSSSNVAVVYTDPSNIYQTISQDLSQRLPLKNLHWNSSTRPLRSIKSLHIEIVPDDKRFSQLVPPPGSRPQSQDGRSTPAFAEGIGAGERPISFTPDLFSRRERRHQIPGLRQTPYLKIYLLRCDNVDTYKASSRKLLREWVKDHTPPSQKSSKYNTQENHDAFEWLILHVVSAETNLDRGSVESKDSRWSKRSSSNLIEKIRTDFNGSSKSAVDRVAQIYFSGETASQNPGDGETGWGDLLFKMKSLILASFDLRVRQYEEDIKEREAQRSLPGWNFNTFFVLKEGLARGFESVGLVEDALTSYHELAAGLQAIIEGQYVENPETDTAQFQEYTDDLSTEITKAAEMHQNASKLSNGDKPEEPLNNESRIVQDLGFDILDTNRKPFRDLILGNKISAFDFQCYVFARQTNLLLRLGHATLSPSDLTVEQSSLGLVESDPLSMEPAREPENLLILADVCQGTNEFVTSACRTMRNELRVILKQDIDPKIAEAMTAPAPPESVVENLVASWTCSAVECILSKTSSKPLSSQLQPLMHQLGPQRHVDSTSKQHFASQNLPKRTSSLLPTTSVMQRPPSPEKFPSVTSLDAMRLLPPTSLHTGAPELAAGRAALQSIQRRALSNVGLIYQGWRSGWPDMHLDSREEDLLEEVPLDDEPKPNGNSGIPALRAKAPRSLMGLRNAMLRTAVGSEASFYAAYEDMTASILGLYVLGDRKKFAEALTADLASVRFHQGDFAVAAAYFRQLAPFYAQGQWSQLELVMLDLYAQCLQKMARKEEYVSIALKMVAKQVEATRKSDRKQHHRLEQSFHNKLPTYFGSLIDASKSLEKPIVTPMERYFDHIVVDPRLHHDDDDGTVHLLLLAKHHMSEDVHIEEIQICLTRMAEEQRIELCFTATGITISPDTVTKIRVRSKVMNPGFYAQARVSFRIANIIFQRDQSLRVSSILSASSDRLEELGTDDGDAPTMVNVFPAPEALSAKVLHSKAIHLEQPRSVEICISTGRNDVSHGKLSLRAGTGGLRLRTADAAVISGTLNVTNKSQPGVIEFDAVSAQADLHLEIPYSVETDLKDIVVKLEIAYTTIHGDFIFQCLPKVSILLSLGVNVQDIFNRDALFSKFSLFTASSVPHRLLGSHLDGTHTFEVQSPPLADTELDIFPRQPVSFVAKICRSSDDHQKPAKQDRRLHLQAQYVCLDEEVVAAAEYDLVASLHRSEIRSLTRLLVPHFISVLEARFSVQEYEVIALLREITVGAFEDYRWASILGPIAPQALDWLSAWHNTHPTIPLSTSSPPPPLLHHLTVPVEIPPLQILHTARLCPLTSVTHLALSQVLTAEIIISHTRRWGTDPASDQPLEFVYEATAPADTWLIGGQRKAHFAAKEDQEVKFGLLLLPQRTGHLLYPSIEIRCVRSEDEEALSCETDYLSQAETVHIIPNLTSTTVELDGGGGAWIVDSKGRDGR